MQGLVLPNVGIRFIGLSRSSLNRFDIRQTYYVIPETPRRWVAVDFRDCGSNRLEGRDGRVKGYRQYDEAPQGRIVRRFLRAGKLNHHLLCSIRRYRY